MDYIVDDSEAKKRHKSAYRVIFLIAGFSIGLGLLTVVFNIEFLAGFGFGVFTVLMGLLFLVLGLFVRAGSKLALGIALGLYIIDAILTFVALAAQTNIPPIGAIIVRFVISAAMFRGFAAIDDLRSINETRDKRPTALPQVWSDGESSQQNYQQNYQPSSPTAPARETVRPQSCNQLTQCQFFPSGLRAIFPDGSSQELAWQEIGALVGGQVQTGLSGHGSAFIDIINTIPGDARPLRVFWHTPVIAANGIKITATRQMPYQGLHYLVSYIASQNPEIVMDANTAALLRHGQPQPQQT